MTRSSTTDEPIQIGLDRAAEALDLTEDMSLRGLSADVSGAESGWLVEVEDAELLETLIALESWLDGRELASVRVRAGEQVYEVRPHLDAVSRPSKAA